MSDEIIEAAAPELETTEAETTETVAEEEQPEQTKEKDPWYKRRIDELTKEKWEARRQAERLEQALAQQQKILERLAPEPAAPKAPEIQPPSPENYAGGQYDPRYMQDMLAYQREVVMQDARAAMQAEWQQREQQQQLAQQQQRIEQAETAMRQQHADYDAVISTITQDHRLAQNPTIRQAILETDNGPQIAYLLGRNPALAYEIASLPPIAAGIKLASLMQPPEPSRTPPPVRPLSGTSGSTKKSYADMSASEFIAARNAEERAKRDARYKR